MRKREYAIIGIAVILSVLTGAVYASQVGGQFTVINVSEGMPDTVEERAALEKEAIEIALADPRIKPLTEGKEARILSTLKPLHFTLKYVDNKTETYYAQWDGKNSALVTIRYPDDTGYGFEVNITDRVVGEPRRAIWEEGKYFRYEP